MSIVGNIECKGPAQVLGRTEGELRASDLLISDGASAAKTDSRSRSLPASKTWDVSPRARVASLASRT